MGGSCVAFGCTNRPSKKIPGITFHVFPKNEKRKQIWIMAVRRKNWLPSSHSLLCSKHFQEEMIDRTSLNCVRLRKNAVPTIFEAFPSYLKKDKIEPNVDDESIIEDQVTADDVIPRTEEDLIENLLETSFDSDNSHCSTDKAGELSKKRLEMTAEEHEKKQEIENEVDDETIISDQKETDDENISSSEEDLNENFLKTIFESDHSLCPMDNPEKFLKRKLEIVTEQHENARKRMKFYQRKCNLYVKQSIALKDIIHSLKQINSVPNDIDIM